MLSVDWDNVLIIIFLSLLVTTIIMQMLSVDWNDDEQ